MIYAIGDVHGEAEALREMLVKLPLQPADLVVFLGDLINRGPASFDCIEQVLAFDRCHKVCLQGNHEETLVAFMTTGDLLFLEGMGGQSTRDSYELAGYPLQPGDPESLPAAHWRFFAQAEPWTLPFYITDDYIFTHTGWNLARPLEQQSPEAMRWGRVIGFEYPVWSQTVVRGHTPMPKVTFAQAKRYIGVDTGCGMGGFLSAVALPTGKTWSVRPDSFTARWYYGISAGSGRQT